MRATRLKPSGFTLTEILVSTILIVLISSLGINAIQVEWNREKISAASNELLGWLEAARRSSLRGSSCLATITEGVVRPGEVMATSTCSGIQPIQLSSSSQAYSVTITTKRNGVTANQIGFTSRGTIYSYNGSDTIITLRLSTGNNQRCILISGLLGDMATGSFSDNICNTSMGG